MSSQQKNWYLRKQDGSEYGPVSTVELLRWAAQSRIIAGNGISEDRETWQKVEDLPELEMDWIAHRPDGKEYGPFHIAATRELHEHDVLSEDTVLSNIKTQKQVTVAQVLNEGDLTPPPPESDSDEKDTPEPYNEPDEIEEQASQSVRDEQEEPEPDSEPEPDNSKIEQELDDIKSQLLEQKNEHKKELAAANKAIADLTAQLKSAQKALADTESKKTQEDQQQASAVESMREEAEQLQAQLEEERKRVKAVEADLKRLENERSGAEEQALLSMAELRKQTAFMKKNNATLQTQLEAAQAKAAARGKALVMIISVLGILGATYLLVMPGCSEEPTAAGSPKAVPPEKSTIHPDQTATEVAGSPEVRADVPDVSAPVIPLEPWPKILVEGVKVETSHNICMMRFDEGVFTRMTTPSEPAIKQMKEIANIINPKMDKFQLIVQGHTDDTPMRNTATYNGNYALGLARAETVRKILISEGKLPIDSVRAVSAGEQKAPYPNNSADNRKRNRTVVLKLVRR